MCWEAAGVAVRTREAASVFASNFIGSLNSCFSTYRTARSAREQMWERYYKLRSSEGFVTRWAEFLQASVGSEACPIFYQFVTDSIMEVLIKEHFPIEMACSEQKLASLDFEEANALRYTAGYVIRALCTYVIIIHVSVLHNSWGLFVCSSKDKTLKEGSCTWLLQRSWSRPS